MSPRRYASRRPRPSERTSESGIAATASVPPAVASNAIRIRSRIRWLDRCDAIGAPSCRDWAAGCDVVAVTLAVRVGVGGGGEGGAGGGFGFVAFAAAAFAAAA